MDPNFYQDIPFETRFLNVERIFYGIYSFFKKLFGSRQNISTDFNFDPNFDPNLNVDFGVGSRFSSPDIDFSSFGFFLENLSYFLILLFLTIIIYVIVRMFEIRKKEKEFLEEKLAEYSEIQKGDAVSAGSNSINPNSNRWKKILEHLFSDKESDWKLSIIEADAMLYDLLDSLSFKGDTLGEKLKNTNREEFRLLSSAWEVHVLRNRIAHEGMAYELSLREARRAVSLYEQIFREYDFI